MKKILTLLVLVFISYSAQSQILISLIFGDKLNSDKLEFGLDGGINFSQMSGFESSDYLITFNLGFYFDITIQKQWYLHTGVLVKSNTGLANLSENDVLILDPVTVFSGTGNYNQRISYFHIPIGIKYRFRNHFYILCGPQLALRSDASLVYFEEVNNSTTEIKVNNRDLFAPIEAAVIGGIGYKLRRGEGMNIGVKYYYGFTNIIKDGQTDARNRSLYINVGIPIGKDKTGSDSKTE